MTVSQFKSLPHDVAMQTLGQRIQNNIEHCIEILKRLPGMGIQHYRISSSMFPVVTYEPLGITVAELPNWDEIQRLMAQIAPLADALGITCSVHPGQTNVLSSLKESTVTNTIEELNFTGRMLDAMGFPRSYETPINIHVSCCRSLPHEAAERFEAGYNRLADSARDRLVIENEDHGLWSVEELLRQFWQRLGIPITFDFLHHKCLPGTLSEEAAFHAAVETWGSYTPVFHYAESRGTDSAAARRQHADYCEHLPTDYGVPYICEIEAKMKDLAICRMLSRSESQQCSPAVRSPIPASLQG